MTLLVPECRCKHCIHAEVWFNKKPCKECLTSPYGSSKDHFESKVEEEEVTL